MGSKLNSALLKELVATPERLPHAMLLQGPRGVGKLLLAQDVAEALLCESPLANGLACNSCEACAWLKQGSHPDYCLVRPEAYLNASTGVFEESKKSAPADKKASEVIRIEQIRGLEDFLHVGSHRQGRKVIVIEPAESMNRSTANALLKALEEPVAGTYFILVTHEPARLLATIRSRCRQIPVPVPTKDVAENWTRQQLPQMEGASQIQALLALSGGAPLLAIDYAKPPFSEVLPLLTGILAEGRSLNPFRAATQLDKALRESKMVKGSAFCIDLIQKWLCDLLCVSFSLQPRYFPHSEKVIERLGAAIPNERLLAEIKKTLQYREICEQPLNARLFFENIFLSYQAIFLRK